jgi:hypothetical protein
LTPDGWGELSIGMSEAEAVRHFGLTIPSDDDGVSSFACREMLVEEGLVVMTEKGVVTRISAWTGIETDRGLKVGSQETDVRRIHGLDLSVETHKYDDEPAHYLTAWTVPGRRGVRYETNQQGVVTVIHAGGKSIEYVEGCL